MVLHLEKLEIYFLAFAAFSGLCLIGTIVDLVNYKKMTFTFNQQVAIETAAMVKMMA